MKSRVKTYTKSKYKNNNKPLFTLWRSLATTSSWDIEHTLKGVENFEKDN